MGFIAKEKGTMVGGGRGGSGNIVHKDQVARPPAPMDPCLEVETARDRLTTHGRGGEGNRFWHVLEEGHFMSIIEHEQKVALLKRAEGLKSAESGPLGDRVGSPMSDGSSLWHTESGSEDGLVAGGGSRKFSFGGPLSRALRSLPQTWYPLTFPPPLTLPIATTAPITPIDRLRSPESLRTRRYRLSLRALSLH